MVESHLSEKRASRTLDALFTIPLTRSGVQLYDKPTWGQVVELGWVVPKAHRHLSLLAFAATLNCLSTLRAQDAPKLSLDPTRPIVYVEFEGSGSRERIDEVEPDKGFWLRLVNNSILSIDVETMSTATKRSLVLLPDEIVPLHRRIPKSGPHRGRMPRGYSSGLGAATTIAPGKSIEFSVPCNHVSQFWLLRVPFRFHLSPVAKGVQPTSYAPFTWEDLPQSDR